MVRRSKGASRAARDLRYEPQKDKRNPCPDPGCPRHRVGRGWLHYRWPGPEERNCDGPTKSSPTNSPDGAGVSRWAIGSTGSRVMSEAG
jgi:hypothetical protein